MIKPEQIDIQALQHVFEECVMVRGPHLLQILLEHLEHGLQFSHLSLESYVTLTGKEYTRG